MSNEPIPTVTWAELGRILEGLAETPIKKMMVQHLLEGTRKQSAFMPAEQVMVEILHIAAAILDHTFQPIGLQLTSGSGTPVSH